MKIKVPAWVVHVESGAVLRCRRISRPNKEMVRRGWRGFVCHVQNESGTGLVEYRKIRIPTAVELSMFNAAVKKRFGF